ncbi:efflux RND transporter permease subunit [Roseomonas alkaliterrae]|uniref:Multidrug efflux pump subunit AcrB n=1 Tax=Neoroseomonas alkaliterrae TaxID=1452450 RepID=A0A840Y6R4_9PROT|nr:efflux RND transporter permease subunit [Neoroseomonas alkaliterrae]MBB5691641.1 multidrug efflux pump subunit AcrB [Neoroseomonas alkaliterrae]MBR0676146.1 efflux RND transporter permease subunit [Neoroseomonas alkaliterrae]
MIGPNLSEWSIKSRSLVVYFMIVALIAGAFAFVKLGRNEDPAFTFRTMIVAAAWPGATIEETMLQVTERLERTLQETPNLDRLRSYTVAGQTTIFVDLKGSTPPAVVPDMWYQVRRRVADMRHTLPQGVVGPFFNDDFGDTFGIIYGFTADGFSQRELRDFVEAARSRLLRVRDVSKVEILGAQDERIFIEFSTERLAGLGLNYGALVAALQAQNLVRPAGVIETGQETLLVRVSGAFETEADILAVNFVIGDRIFRLGDLAQVRRGTADPPQPMFRVNGQPAIGLAVAMREAGDILALGRNIAAEMARIRAELPVGIEPILVADQAQTVDEAIGDFMGSLWQAILIIMAVSFVALGVRAGAIVAMSIPLTLAIVFPLMLLAGIDLQRISLGALIIALTLLVDDAMTTIDAMIRRLAAGDTKEKAATFAYSTLASSMLIGTLVTIAGFVPIGFAKSSAGEYTFSIFAVVGIALIVSWFVAVLFAPLLGVAILKPPRVSAEPEKPSAVLRGYTAFLSLAMRFKWVTIAFTLAMFVVAVLTMPFVPRQFFPSSDRTELLVEVTLPQNASIFASEQVAQRLDAALAADPDVARWSTYVGRGAIRFYLPLNVQLALPFFSQAVVVAKDLPGRERLHRRLEALLAEDFPAAVSRVYPLELGPPVGWPLQYRVSGPDVERVRDIAQEVAALIAAARGARHVHFDWMEPARQMRVRVDQDQARLLGLSSAQVAAAINAAVTGTTVTQLRDDIYLIPVIARATAEQRLSLDTLRAIQVPLPGGRTVPITQFATFDYGQEYPLIWRRDRVPTLTVRADVNPGVLPDTVVAQLDAGIAALNARLEAPYRVDLGGIAEESAYSQASVIAVVPVMLLLMFTLLMFQLKSFRRFGLVLALLPLGIIGVVLALLAFGRPLGFVAILGILALLGMIAKNAIILIMQIESDRAAGHDVRGAVIAAASSRLRPMLLTALSTVLGLIPIAPTVFWGPMAFAIMGGLMVATLLTLVFLPTLYVTVFGGKPAAKPAEA